MRRICESALPIDDERSRERINAAIQCAYGIIAQDDAVIHLLRGNVRFDRLPSVLIHGNANDLEALALILLLEFDEPGDFEGTGTAPGRPEIEHHDLASQVTEFQRIPVRVLERKIRSRLSLTGSL